MGAVVRTCSVGKCEGKVKAKGRCNSHYMIHRRTGADIDPSRPYGRSVEDSLLFYTHVTPSGCWEWAGTRHNGYGRFAGVAAHRLAYETWVGHIPDGLLIRHKCDNPPCINPEHLETGTDQDNMDDRQKRGRTASGPRHGFSKLDEDAVRAIRSAYSSGRSMRSIAREYGVHHATVSNVVNRRTYTTQGGNDD